MNLNTRSLLSLLLLVSLAMPLQAAVKPYSKVGSSPIQVSIKPYTAGLIMRGKYDGTKCETPRGNMAAGYCQVYWKDIEPVKGQFNWSVIDKAVTAAKSYNAAQGLTDKDGYKVMIRIRTGVYAPDWVKSDPNVGKISWQFKNSSPKQTFQLPLFWNTPYQNHYENLMQAAANRYDNELSIGGVAASMCMTVHTEIMWNRTGRKEVRAANMSTMRALGDKSYTNEKDYACLQRQIQIHSNTWQKTPTLFGSHLYQVYNYSNGGKSSDYNKTKQLFNECRSSNKLGKRCVLGNNSLRHDEVNNDGSVNQLLFEIAQAGDPVYFQTNVFKSDRKKRFGVDELKGAMDNAANWGAVAVEIPMAWDCSDYFNKSGCSSATVKQRQGEFHSYQNRLKNNVVRISPVKETK